MAGGTPALNPPAKSIFMTGEHRAMSIIPIPTPSLGRIISQHPVAFGHKWGKLALGLLFLALGPGVYLWISLMWATPPYALQSVTETTPFLQYLPFIASGA